MRDPGLAQLELAMTYHCDNLLDNTVLLESGEVVLTAHWYFRSDEFRVRLVVPPGQQITWPTWLHWKLGGQQFRHLPSRPVFGWYGPLGWQQAFSVAQWQRVLRNAGGAAPDTAPGEFTGRPVRPRPGWPRFSAGVAAVPERVEYEVRRYPVVMLDRRGVEE